MGVLVIFNANITVYNFLAGTKYGLSDRKILFVVLYMYIDSIICCAIVLFSPLHTYTHT